MNMRHPRIRDVIEWSGKYFRRLLFSRHCQWCAPMKNNDSAAQCVRLLAKLRSYYDFEWNNFSLQSIRCRVAWQTIIERSQKYEEKNTHTHKTGVKKERIFRVYSFTAINSNCISLSLPTRSFLLFFRRASATGTWTYTQQKYRHGTCDKRSNRPESQTLYSPVILLWKALRIKTKPMNDETTTTTPYASERTKKSCFLLFLVKRKKLWYNYR